MREYLLVLLVAIAVTYLGSSLARRYAYRFNAVAFVRDRDVHTRPIPYFGGIAMLAGVAAAFIVATNLPWLGSFPLVKHDSVAVFAAGVLLAGVGALDDLIDLSAAAKLSGQVLAAGIVVMNGVRFYWIPLPGRVLTLDSLASILLAVFVILVAINAINLMDGLDGLAAGVVTIGAGAFFVYAYLLSYQQDLVRATTSSLLAIVTLGACLGFLPHNIHPARMFMGDSGSMLLGLLLACSVISLTGQIDPSMVQTSSSLVISAYLPLILPFAVMALPFFDLLSAYVRRTIAGRPWYKADKQHLHHRMLELGHSHGHAVALLWLWSFVFSFGSVFVGVVGTWWSLLLWVIGIAVAATLTWGRRKARTHG